MTPRTKEVLEAASQYYKARLIMNIMHSLGRTLRDSRGTELFDLAAKAYNCNNPLTEQFKNMIDGLLED
ncbi:hypothetical protein M422DRAFT_72445, partial [Sphaerobolus stellatus SS14]